MAGTLQVENLIGPTTGANANKVSIPSGQILYVPGHVIQHQYSYYNYSGASNETETSSSSWTASGFNVTITPSSTSSRIIFMAALNIKRTVNSNQSYLDLQVRRSIAGGAYAVTSPSEDDGDQARHSDHSASLEYTQLTLIVPDHPNTTSAVNYKVYIRNAIGSNSNVMRVGDNGSNEFVHVMEIAQ